MKVLIMFVKGIWGFGDQDIRYVLKNIWNTMSFLFKKFI